MFKYRALAALTIAMIGSITADSRAQSPALWRVPAASPYPAAVATQSLPVSPSDNIIAAPPGDPPALPGGPSSRQLAPRVSPPQAATTRPRLAAPPTQATQPYARQGLPLRSPRSAIGYGEPCCQSGSCGAARGGSCGCNSGCCPSHGGTLQAPFVQRPPIGAYMMPPQHGAFYCAGGPCPLGWDAHGPAPYWP